MCSKNPFQDRRQKAPIEDEKFRGHILQQAQAGQRKSGQRNI